jgi:glycosyltransferase involved in cell wall biosynthesis
VQLAQYVGFNSTAVSEETTISMSQARSLDPSQGVVDPRDVPVSGRKKIALFFAATGGGVQKTEVALATALTNWVDVECVLPQARGEFLDRLPPQVKVVDLGTRRPLLLVPRLARYLRRSRPAAVVASQQHAILAAIWARAVSRAPTRLVITQHNSLSDLCSQSRRPEVRLFLPLLARAFFRFADQVTAVSKGVADDLATVARISRDRIEVIYNPVRTADLAGEAAAPTGHPWVDRKDRPLVLGAGDLAARKDFATLIRAFARVRSEQLARLVIIGEGEDRSSLLRLAKDLGIAEDVDLPGFTRNPYAYMARADVFALTSRFEGLGNVLIEALACGCPVVSTNCPSGPAEILEDGRYGSLAPVGDDVAIAKALRQTMQNPPDRAFLRSRADFFSIDRAVEQYLRAAGLHEDDLVDSPSNVPNQR